MPARILEQVFIIFNPFKTEERERESQERYQKSRSKEENMGEN
jgi:hypothetical protein